MDGKRVEARNLAEFLELHRAGKLNPGDWAMCTEAPPEGSIVFTVKLDRVSLSLGAYETLEALAESQNLSVDEMGSALLEANLTAMAEFLKRQPEAPSGGLRAA